MSTFIDSIFDKDRLEATAILSPSIRKKPELIVEGYLDMRILTSSCQYFRRSVNFTYPSKDSGKKGVIDDFKSRKGETNLWALVDTDHEFETKHESPKLMNTTPWVTLASSIYYGKRKEENHIRSIVSKILMETKLSNVKHSDYVKIRDISRGLNIAKLYSGYSRKAGRYHELNWFEVTSSKSDDRIEGMLNIIFPVKEDRLKLIQFRERHALFLSKCGINDHRIEEAISLFLKSKGVSVSKKELENYTKKTILEDIKASRSPPILPFTLSEVMIELSRKQYQK